jgi:hypothetical protein
LKKTKGRSRYRWDDNTEMDLKDITYEDVDLTSDSGKGPVVGCCENDNESLGSIKERVFLD